MTIHSIMYYFISLFFLTLSCRDNNIRSHGFKDQQQSGPVAADAVAEDSVTLPSEFVDETITPPANITGAYLSCRMDQAAKVESPSSRIVCGLKDNSSKKKVDIETILKNSEFKMEISAEIAVTQILLVNDLEWHVLFTLNAVDITSLQNALSGAQVLIVGMSADDSKQPMAQKVSLSKAIAADSPASSSNQIANPQYTNVQSFALTGQAIAGVSQLACRGFYSADNAYHLGHSFLGAKSCSSAFGSSVETSSDFVYITQDTQFVWIEGTSGMVPLGAIAFQSELNGSIEYLCRAFIAGVGTLFGKIDSSLMGCEVVSREGYVFVADALPQYLGK